MVDWYQYPTNFSNGTDVTGPASLFFKYPNHILNSGFGAGLTILIFLMSFVLTSSAGSRKSLGISCFISFVFSLYFVNMGGYNLVITMALLIFGIVAIVFSRNEGGTL